MNDDELMRRAKDFVERVIKLNRDRGGVVAMTPEEKEKVVSAAAAPFRKLRPEGVRRS